VLQCVAVCCSVLQCVATRVLPLEYSQPPSTEVLQRLVWASCNTLHHTAPHCNTLHHTATHLCLCWSAPTTRVSALHDARSASSVLQCGQVCCTIDRELYRTTSSNIEHSSRGSSVLQHGAVRCTLFSLLQSEKRANLARSSH